MANEEEYVIKVDSAKAKTQLADFEKKLTGMFDKGALKAALYNKALGAGQAILSGLINVMKTGIKQALEYERTTIQLTAALRGAGYEGERWVGLLQSQSSNLQTLTGISDDQIRQYQIMALNAGATADKTDELVRASISLSNAFGMELGAAMKNLIKTQSGLTGELGEAIPWIRDLSAEQLAAGDAIDLVNDKLGNQLGVLTQGGAGAAVGLNNAWDDFTEALGKAVTRSDEFKTSAGALTTTLSTMAQVFEKGGVLAGIGAGLDIALLGGEGAAETLERYKRIEELDRKIAEAQEDLRVTMAGGGLDFGMKGGGVESFTVGPEKKKKKKGGMQFEMEEGFGGIFAGGDAVYVEGVGYMPLEEYTAKQNLRYDLEADLQSRLQEMRMGMLEHWAGIEEQKTKLTEQQAEMRAKAEQDSHGKSARAAVKASQMALGAVQAFAQGGILGALQYGASMASAFGMQSIASGTAHEALAASFMAIPGMQAAGAALAATAANEIAVGTALAIGGQVASAGMSLGKQAASGGFDDFDIMTGAGGGGGSGGGGGAGGGARGGVGGAGGGFVAGMDPGFQESQGDAKQVTIVLQGPVYDGAQAGRAIAEKLDEARRQGLV